MLNLRGTFLSIGFLFWVLKGFCASANQPQESLLRSEIAGFKPLAESHKMASSPRLEPVLGALAMHFANRGVMAVEKASFVRDGRSLQVLLFLFHDRRGAKDYYLFWRALEMLNGPVKDLEVSLANACTFSITSGRWALLVGRALALIEPQRNEDIVPQKFLEGLARALMEPPRPKSVEIKLPLKRSDQGNFVTLRDLAEAIKAPLTYDRGRGEAFLRIRMFLLAFKPSRLEVVVGDASLPLPSPPVLIEGRICLTPEALEALTGAKVEVDEKGGIVKLLFPATGPPESGYKAQECIAPKGASEGVEGRVP